MRKAAVIGYGKSGAGAEKILSLSGYDVDIFDDFKGGCRKISDFIDEYDVVSVSPGLDLKKLPKIRNITNEIDLAYSVLPDLSRVIAVTGTNGKSTVTHFACQILQKAGFTAVACGNIGLSFADAALKAGEGTVFVLELSSYQIDLLKNLSVDAACIINITPDHLDRYGCFDNYESSKLRLVDFIASRGVLISEPRTEIVNKVLRTDLTTFYMDSDFEAWPRLAGSILDFTGYKVDLKAFPLRGKHNIINMVFALSLANAIAHFEGDATGLIKGLKGMPHRMEEVLLRNGVSWVNDSKATNVSSTIIALKCYDSGVNLLLGGRDKNSDYSELSDDINRCVKRVLLFGEAAEKIRSHLEGKTSVYINIFKKLEDAVEYAANNSGVGETVLLSPSCSSFDEFDNFEDRGLKFTAYAGKYASGHN